MGILDLVKKANYCTLHFMPRKLTNNYYRVQFLFFILS